MVDDWPKMSRAGIIILLLTLGVAGWCLGQILPGDSGPAVRPEPAADAGPTGRGPTTMPASQPDRPHGGPRFRPLAGRMALPLTDKQAEEVIQFLEAEQPELFETLRQVKGTDPARYRQMLEKAAPSTLYLMELKLHSPEVYGLYKEEMKARREIDRLADQIRLAADPGEKSTLVNQLRMELAARFDLTQERQRLQIQQFHREVQRLEGLLRTRQANREKIIERELQRIVELAGHGPAGRLDRPGHGLGPAAAVEHRDSIQADARMPRQPGPASQPEHE